MLPYFLADGIYPNWRIFVKTVTDGNTVAERLFAAAQEAVRKDVERALGVLVARLHILTRGCRLWYKRDMDNVMKKCVMIQNIVVEACRDKYESGMAALGMFDDTRSIFQGNPQFAGK